MDTQIVTELITQAGFPIVAFLLIFYLYEKSIKSFTETLGKMEILLEELSDFIRDERKKEK